MLRVVNRRRATGRHSLIPVSPNPASAPTAADLVDWDAAARLARIATPAGPHVPDAIRRASVALLRRSVDDALPWAGRITGLPGPARSAALNAEILVVDRAGLMTASAAWLRGLTGALVAAVRNADAVRTEPDEQSDEQDEQPDGPPLGDLLTAPGREHLTRLVALLTLLEGHADAVLDAVEPGRMPSVHRLRAVLSRTPRSYGRGLSAGPGALLGRLIGLDAKETQYADGAAFARAVIARVGHKGLNTVWAAPDNLPLPDEIARPEQRIERLGL